MVSICCNACTHTLTGSAQQCSNSCLQCCSTQCANACTCTHAPRPRSGQAFLAAHYARSWLYFCACMVFPCARPAATAPPNMERFMRECKGGGGVTMFPTRLTHTHVTLLLQGAITATPVLEQRSTTTLHQGTSCLGSLGCVTNAQLMVMADACDCDLLAAAPARGKQSTQKARRCVVHSVRVETECMSAY